MINSQTKNFIYLGLIIGVFVLIGSFILASNKTEKETPINSFVEIEKDSPKTSCEKELPELKKRILAAHDQAYVVDQVYSNVSDIKTYYSPLLGNCIYSLKEQYFIQREGEEKEYTNSQRKIFNLDTDRELFSVMTETRFGGSDENKFREFISELEKYTQE